MLPEGGLQDAAAGPGAGQQGELLLRGEAGAGRLHGAGTHHPPSPALVTASVLGTAPPSPAPARATLMVFIVGLDTVCPPPHVTAAPRSSPKLYFIELFTRVYPCTRCRSVSGPACSATPTPSTWTSRQPPTCTTSKHTEYLVMNIYIPITVHLQMSGGVHVQNEASEAEWKTKGRLRIRYQTI